MQRACTAQGEMNALVLKGFLENNNIHASIAPDSYMNRGGSSQSYVVLVEDGKVEEALKLLKEQGLITP